LYFLPVIFLWLAEQYGLRIDTTGGEQLNKTTVPAIVMLIMFALVGALYAGTMQMIPFFLFGLYLSFGITPIAITLGLISRASSPDLHENLLILSNIFMDGLTLIVTFSILYWVVEHPGFLRIPIAIILDICLAAIFAFLSLYFGLVGSSDALTVSEVFNALIARSMDGTRFEIGPFFWVMHTTFIPTLIYLFLILAAWVAKGFVLPVSRYLKTAGINDNPLQLTARLCVVFVALFAFFAYLSDAGMQHAKRQLKPQQETTAKP